MIFPRPSALGRFVVTAVAWISAGLLSAVLQANDLDGLLQLTIVDAATREPVPARVEILGSDMAYHVAEDALLFGGDCDMSDQGAGYVDYATTLAGFTDRVFNYRSNSTHFYSDGTSHVRLPKGPTTISVWKGPEYRTAIEEVQISTSTTEWLEITLDRWINMPERGWYSADDHLHIPRPDPQLNPLILKMMQAEDLHVANLLQMGKVRNFRIAQQYAHGPDSHFQQGDYILAAGQENPRSHFLGHTITLGANSPLHNPDKYLIYRLVWQQAVEQGAINGFAHAYFPSGSIVAAHDGLALVLPHDLLHFMEVLQFNRSGYEAWYEVLNLGFRITPTAGTDFPCADQTIPGNERFFTKVDGPLTYARWLESVRKGRTFVTTGPMIEFSIDGQEIGGEIDLESPGEITLKGSAKFNPARDDLAFLELVENGRVVGRFSRTGEAGEIEFSVQRNVSASSWFAVRGFGKRIDPGMLVKPLHHGLMSPRSHVHTAPIYVSLRNSPPIGKDVRAQQTAQTWIARLEDMKRILAEHNMERLAAQLASPDWDSVPEEILVSNRQELIHEIDVALKFFGKFVQEKSGAEG